MPRQHIPRDGDAAQAHGWVNYQVRLGRFPRASTVPCIDCGRPAHDYDHHLGYGATHHLDVQPVCRGCHMRRGVARGERKPPPKRTNVSICAVCGTERPPFRRGRCNACRLYLSEHGVERPNRLWTTARH